MPFQKLQLLFLLLHFLANLVFKIIFGIWSAALICTILQIQYLEGVDIFEFWALLLLPANRSTIFGLGEFMQFL